MVCDAQADFGSSAARSLNRAAVTAIATAQQRHNYSDKCETLYSVIIYTVNHKKTWHFIFDYNYDISWPIFTFFAANETGINTLHFT